MKASAARSSRSAPISPTRPRSGSSLNNQYELEGFDVSAAQGNRSNTRGQVGLVLTSSSEEEGGDLFRTGCPLSVAPQSRSRPLRHVDRDISVRAVTHRHGCSAF